jgi:Protein of unknown function (DUF4058)
VDNPNSLLTRIEAARLWSYFHKDWLLQIRLAVRRQLPAEYRVFVESESVLVTPEPWEAPLASIQPDVAVSRAMPPASTPIPESNIHRGTAAVIEADEPCEVETHYTLLIRRAPENHVVAAAELLSPSNKGLSNRLDQQKHLRKRSEYFDAGINLLELDPLTQGQRVLPDALAALSPFERVVWTAFHDSGRRRFRGFGWNEADPVPQIEWRIDMAQGVLVDLGATLAEAVEFNDWESLVQGDG